MLSFFGVEPQDILFEPVSATSFKFKNTLLQFTAQDAVALQIFVTQLCNEIKVLGCFSIHNLILKDTDQISKLFISAKHNATTQIQLFQNQKPISPRYCVYTDTELVCVLSSLFKEE